jgi:hypothetical protein
MEAASIGDISFFGPLGKHTSGAAFTLSAASQVTVEVPVGKCWRLCLKEGSATAVVRGGRAASYQGSLKGAREAGNRGLDILSVRGMADLTLDQADVDHVVWWREGSLTVARVFAVYIGGFTMTANVTVTDSRGRVKKHRPEPRPIWHESYRYFRMGQVSDDLWDAYRNSYLALECILDDLVTAKSPRSSEQEWLKAAIGAVLGPSELAPLIGARSRRPLDTLVHDIYTLNRTAVFHAKTSRRRHIPGTPKSAVELTSSLYRLQRTYLLIAEKKLASRRRSSGLSQEAFDVGADASFGSNPVVVVCDDDSPFDPADLVFSPAGRPVVPLLTIRVPDFDQRLTRHWLGSISAVDLPDLKGIARLGMTADGQPTLVQCRDDSLTLGGIDRFEILLRYQVEGHAPRARFSR